MKGKPIALSICGCVVVVLVVCGAFTIHDAKVKHEGFKPNPQFIRSPS